MTTLCIPCRTLVNRVRKGKDDPDEDKKTDTSNSEKEARQDFDACYYNGFPLRVAIRGLRFRLYICLRVQG